MALALYVHVPFCQKKCPYCDFVSFAGVEQPAMERYAAAVALEAALWAERIGPVELSSVYVGGGTPTLWPVSCWEILWQAVRRYFRWPTGIEVTVEANPGTVDAGLLRALRESGVNRLSLGAQSFDDRLLLAAGRRHRARDVVRAVALARASGFANINLDLIYGLPGQSLTDWQKDLEAALALEPTHLSCYELQLDPHTPWGREKAAGKLNLPPEEELAAMYEYACARLYEAGFEHYELSNFARPGYACRHNLTYWQRLPYLGLGVAASSFIGERRWSNTSFLAEYIETVSAGRLPVAEVEELTPEDAMGETLFLGLRLRRGVDTAAFEQAFGKKLASVYGQEIASLKAQGLLEERGGTLRLTDRGLLLGNVVFRAFV